MWEGVGGKPGVGCPRNSIRNYEFLNSFYSEMGGRRGEVSLQEVP